MFIIGLSRSGTKLLRDLLNNHSTIFIPAYETHFIPKLIKINQNSFSFEISFNLLKESKFYQYFQETYFLNENELREFVDKSEYKLQAFMKYVLTFYGYGKYTENIIWGDKTPKNLRELESLNRTFNGVKFIHIIRDPRDRCISVKKTWWKSIYRAAYLWNKEINETEVVKKASPELNYLEINFESLLLEPADELKRVCTFLNICYEEGMDSLNKPSEKYGVASNSQNIVSDNKNKFLEYDMHVIEKIEQICYSMLKKKGYKVFYAKEEITLSKFHLFLFKIYDALMFKLSVKLKGY